MQKIKKLEKELKSKKEEELKFRKQKEHIARQMDKHLDHEKKFSKYYIEQIRCEEKLKKIRIEIAAIEGDIGVEKAKVQTDIYNKEFIAFKRALAEDFTTFLNLLDKEKYQEASEQLEEVEAQYSEGSRQLLPSDLKPLTSYFTFVSLKRHIAIILSRVGEAHRLKTTRGLPIAKGYEGGTKEKVKIVYGIVESIIQILMPTVKREKKKVKQKQPKKQEPKKEPTFKSIEEGRIEWIKEESSKRKSPEERAKEQFLKWKKQKEKK